MSILDSIMCILFILGGIYWVLFFMIFPVMGYFSSSYYHRGLAFGYLIYLFLILGVRIALALIVDDTTYTVIQSIIIVVQFVIIIYVIKYIMILGQLTPQ